MRTALLRFPVFIFRNCSFEGDSRKICLNIVRLISIFVNQRTRSSKSEIETFKFISGYIEFCLLEKNLLLLAVVPQFKSFRIEFLRTIILIFRLIFMRKTIRISEIVAACTRHDVLHLAQRLWL